MKAWGKCSFYFSHSSINSFNTRGVCSLINHLFMFTFSQHLFVDRDKTFYNRFHLRFGFIPCIIPIDLTHLNEFSLAVSWEEREHKIFAFWTRVT